MGTGAWVLAVGLVVATLALTLQAQRQAQAARQAWGDTARVWVTLRPVPGGATLATTDVQVREVPRAFLPEGAVPAANEPDQRAVPDEPDQPDEPGAVPSNGATGTHRASGVVGRVTLVAMGAGEIVVQDRLGPAGSMPMARWLGPDTVALPVPSSLIPWAPALVASGTPVALIHRDGLVNGQVVSAAGSSGPTATNEDPTGIEPVLQPGSERTTLVVVPRSQAPALVAALLDGQLMVALISSPPQSTG
ncbi:MAG: SAF domain-containing protein [Acidimicrobiales bacterium]